MFDYVSTQLASFSFVVVVVCFFYFEAQLKYHTLSRPSLQWLLIHDLKLPLKGDLCVSPRAAALSQSYYAPKTLLICSGPVKCGQLRSRWLLALLSEWSISLHFQYLQTPNSVASIKWSQKKIWVALTEPGDHLTVTVNLTVPSGNRRGRTLVFWQLPLENKISVIIEAVGLADLNQLWMEKILNTLEAERNQTKEDDREKSKNNNNNKNLLESVLFYCREFKVIYWLLAI